MQSGNTALVSQAGSANEAGLSMPSVSDYPGMSAATYSSVGGPFYQPMPSDANMPAYYGNVPGGFSTAGTALGVGYGSAPSWNGMPQQMFMPSSDASGGAGAYVAPSGWPYGMSPGIPPMGMSYMPGMLPSDPSYSGFPAAGQVTGQTAGQAAGQVAPTAQTAPTTTAPAPAVGSESGVGSASSGAREATGEEAAPKRAKVTEEEQEHNAEEQKRAAAPAGEDKNTK